MPAVSQKQKRLMAWAYACKTGKAKNCPDNIMKVGKSMSIKQLRDFFEGIIYKTKKSNKDLLQNFLIWMDNRDIEYIYDEEEDELEIYNEFDLSKDDQQSLIQQANKLNLEKIWEKGEFVFEDGEGSVDGGTSVANLGNVHGMGSVRPAATTVSNSGGVDVRGSGDRFDNFEDEDDDDEEKKRLKAKKKKEAIEKAKKKHKDDTEEHKRKQKGVKMEGIFISIDEFENSDIQLLDERLTAKRKYTDRHPAVDINYSAPVRNKVLAFVSEKGSVTQEELKEFFSSLEEDLGRKANWNWVSSNRSLIKKFESNGETHYKLTERGARVLKGFSSFSKQK